MQLRKESLKKIRLARIRTLTSAIPVPLLGCVSRKKETITFGFPFTLKAIIIKNRVVWTKAAAAGIADLHCFSCPKFVCVEQLILHCFNLVVRN